MEPDQASSPARVTVLDRADVDTDQIIPKQFLKRIERTGFGEFLFYDWAQEPGWDLPTNPILATGPNFGCGSIREHAPWALQDYGFQAVVAPSLRRHLLLQLHEDRPAAGRAARGGRARADGGGRGRGRPRGARGALRRPRRAVRARRRDAATGCSTASTTSRSRCSRPTTIAAYEAERERPGPVTLNLYGRPTYAEDRLLPGDGIGPEVAAAAVEVLDAVAADLTFDEHSAAARRSTRTAPR